ncbi:Putative leucine-rich repeat domain superfamily [Colletotrichum destructivum]|uniref:Leucine-rich repeat domain superfamily n=1 Tax=Colletotrichum destructivum TaxID=34406 RepID=A0AAX4J3Y3_9PEZI|nr:Putative leucine-rich repeat domain superfamily [Colletotrichum destructivum]
MCFRDVAKLTDLPVEILQKIFSELIVWASQTNAYLRPAQLMRSDCLRALASLSQTSRFLHHAVEPFLNKHIKLCHRSGTRRAIALLRHWHRHPAAAASLRTLTTCGMKTIDDNDPKPLAGEDAAFLDGLLRRYGLQVPDRWLDTTACVSMLIGMVLLHARNIRALDLNDDLKHFTALLPKNVVAAIRFDLLTSLRVRQFDPTPLENILPLLRLAPNLITVDLYQPEGGLGDGEVDWGNIHHLTLRGSLLPVDQLIRIIKACRNLRLFHYESNNVFVDQAVIRALLHHTSTLSSLQLVLGGRHTIMHENADIYPDAMALPSVSRFSELRSLCLSERYMGSDSRCVLSSLPSALEKLTVDDDMDALREVGTAGFEALAGRFRNGEYPQLREVTLGTFFRAEEHHYIIRKILTDVGLLCHVK